MKRQKSTAEHSTTNEHQQQHNGDMGILRYLVCEESVGVCFYEQLWKYPPGLNCPDIGWSQMVPLIRSLYQFSRTLGDGGDDVHICFEEKERSIGRVQS